MNTEHTAPEAQSELLFSYGTLQQESVQLATFGRRLIGKTDALAGYRLAIIRIDDQEFVASSGSADHRNVQFTGHPSDVVEGMAFTVTPAELALADAYEPDGYTRHLVQLKSGLNAWVYSAQHQPTADLS